ncbi:hypothetical protein EDB80DRAFT_110450 [Ilyonectria destructans]|nr:hypothetical protein EDB80DRAFT_110450 [Ilyonectria destructans]
MFVLESNYCHITSYIPTRWTIRSWLPVYVSACLHVYVSTSLPVCHLFQACSFQVCPFSNSLRLGSSRVDKENRLCWAGIRPKRQSSKLHWLLTSSTQRHQTSHRPSPTRASESAPFVIFLEHRPSVSSARLTVELVPDPYQELLPSIPQSRSSAKVVLVRMEHTRALQHSSTPNQPANQLRLSTCLQSFPSLTSRHGDECAPPTRSA